MTAPPMACGINVYCSGPADPGLGAALDDLASLGYTHIAFAPMGHADVDVTALRQTMANAGIAPIAMAGLSPEADVSSASADIRQRGIALLRSTVDFAHDLGADQLNGVSYALFGERSQPYPPDRFAASAEAVGQVADYAAQAGITLTFEVVNRYETSMLNTAAQARDYLERSGSTNLRVHLDTYHMGIEEADPAGAIAATVPVLGYLELGQSGRGSLLTGSVDIAAAIAAARDAGFTGRFGLEAFTRQLLDEGGGNGLAIWRQTYTDPHTIAAEAIDLVRAAYQEP
ncbi:MAG: sugar phosphate isomerase/epimerase family protein [Propioniciclava sp.]